MYRIKPSTQFGKDLKKLQKRNYNLDLLKNVIHTLAAGDVLDQKYRDHALSGNFAGCRECYIQPDWLLIYEVQEDELFLYLTRTGTHSDLFK